MADDVNTLLDEAKCYACADGKQLQLLTLALLRQYVLCLDPDAMTDTDSLLEQAKCYACATDKQLKLLELALLAQIVDSTSDLAGGVLCGSGPPAGPPTSTCAVYVDTDTYQIYWYVNGLWMP